MQILSSRSPDSPSTPSPLVLTLKLDAIAFDSLNLLRQQHFPPKRNFLPAHVTLFHALPGDQELAIRQTLQTLCQQTSRLSVRFPTLRSLGGGVAIEIESPKLIQVRNQLAQGWSGWLSAQDRQGYRPHVTIQNKVTSDEARGLYERLSQVWQPIEGSGEGLLLWHYRGGPWELADEFEFKS
ncbi:2'-5' RNA ligase family protein [Phormidesmis priestleyi]|uniref:2'-5' RNA ligase family protein n=1 Tax=Phormidesmis priestleyi TaxID=268141 RepID=UPI000B11155E|nr:2'-5' RNA ligase family protein [Phormidesmis priestleyi]